MDPYQPGQFLKKEISLNLKKIIQTIQLIWGLYLISIVSMTVLYPECFDGLKKIVGEMKWNNMYFTWPPLLELFAFWVFFLVSHHQIDDPGEGWLNHFNVITLYQQLHISYFTISFSSPTLHTFNTRNNKIKFLRWTLSKNNRHLQKQRCHLGLYIVEDGIFYNNVGLGHCTAKGLKCHDNIFWMAHELANKLHGSVFFNIFICPDVIFILSCLHPFPQPLSHIIILIHGPIQ